MPYFASACRDTCCVVFGSVIVIISFFGGPTLLIMGILLMVGPNHRADDVAAYNAVCGRWVHGHSSAAVLNSSFASDANPLSGPLVQPIVITGDTDGVTYLNASGVYFTVDYLKPDAPVMSFAISATWRTNNISRMMNMSVPGSKIITDEYVCDCDSDSSVNCHCLVDVSDCPSGYQDSYKGASRCSNKDVCGTCYGTQYLTDVCFPLNITYPAFGWSPDVNLQSCTYPFDTDHQGYTANHQTVRGVVIRSSPYLALQRITKGTMTFSMSADTQMLFGEIMVGSGGFLIALFLGVCCYVVCQRRRGLRVEQRSPTVLHEPLHSSTDAINHQKVSSYGATKPQPPPAKNSMTH